MALTLTLTTRVLKSAPNLAGVELYEGGDITDNNRHVGVFTAVHNTIDTVTDANGLDTAMMTLTLFFFRGQHPHSGGGGGGGGHARGQAPENITLQGADEFAGQPSQGQPRPIVQCVGSVSAASQQFAAQIGKQFVRQGDKLTIS